MSVSEGGVACVPVIPRRRMLLQSNVRGVASASVPVNYVKGGVASALINLTEVGVAYVLFV